MKRVAVPIDLLLSRDLTATDKLVWMTSQTGGGKRLAVREITGRSGISKTTVYRCLSRLQKAGWDPSSTDTRASRRDQSHTASVPIELIGDISLGAQARALYGSLQILYRNECTYAQVAYDTSLNTVTVRRAFDELARSGWLVRTQANQRAPVRFALCNPVAQRQEAKVAAARRRIERARFKGEALMREYLTCIVDSEEFSDDAAPGFLVNPDSGERMQFDRYYPPRVAFEFNGPQHYEATDLYGPEDVVRQRMRDLIKIGICVERGIDLVILHADDLSYEKILTKAAPLLPVRTFSSDDPVIRYLEGVGRLYRKSSRRRRGAAGVPGVAARDPQ